MNPPLDTKGTTLIKGTWVPRPRWYQFRLKKIFKELDKSKENP